MSNAPLPVDPYETRSDRASFWARVAQATSTREFAADDESRRASPDVGSYSFPQPDLIAGGR